MMKDENSNSKVPLVHSIQAAPNHPDHRDDEIDLRELFSILWQGKWWIIAITLVFAIGSVIYSLSLPDIYKSEATLAPTEEAQGQALGQELGGLASLAGINMSKRQVDKVTMAMEILQSRQFIKNFVQKHNILPEIMAVKDWHQASGELIYNEEVYNSETNEWIRDVERPQPSSWEYVKVFQESILTVEKSSSPPGLINIVVEHQSPILAQRWVEWLIEDINNHMRQRDINEAQRSMEYLKEELAETNLSSMQQVFYELIEKQTQTIMLANVRPEYIFQVLDPAVIPEQKDAPSRALICIIGTFLGGFLSMVLVFILKYLRSNSPN